jgi:anti-anti-sigma regulatory factor
MFRIKKIFNNKLTTILRIEGDLNNGNLVIFNEEISALVQESEQQIILDGSSVSFVTPNAVELFNDMLSNDIYLLNFPINFRNMLQSAGLSDRLLE